MMPTSFQGSSSAAASLKNVSNTLQAGFNPISSGSGLKSGTITAIAISAVVGIVILVWLIKRK